MTDTLPPRYLHLLGDAAPLHATVAQLADSLGLRFAAHAGARALLRALAPDAMGVVVLNTGFDLAPLADPALRATGLPVVVVARGGTVALCRRAFNGGAADFLAFPLDMAALGETVRASIARQVLDAARRRETQRARRAFASLSEREKDVLALIAAGLTHKEAARALGVSPRTIEVHRARLSVKLEAATVAELVRRYAPLLDELEGADPLPPARCVGRALALGVAA